MFWFLGVLYENSGIGAIYKHDWLNMPLGVSLDPVPAPWFHLPYLPYVSTSAFLNLFFLVEFQVFQKKTMYL